MIKVQVESTEIRVKYGTSARTGRPYSIREQECWVFTSGRDGKPHPHPEKALLTLDDDQEAGYAPGYYVLCPSSIYVDRKFGKLAVRGRLRAVPAVASGPVSSSRAA